MPPGMDGFELAQELHRRYPHIKTLLTSGFPGMFFDKDGIGGAGFTVLCKPYMMADLAEAVRAALDQLAAKLSGVETAGFGFQIADSHISLNVRYGS